MPRGNKRLRNGEYRVGDQLMRNFYLDEQAYQGLFQYEAVEPSIPAQPPVQPTVSVERGFIEEQFEHILNQYNDEEAEDEDYLNQFNLSGAKLSEEETYKVLLAIQVHFALPNQAISVFAKVINGVLGTPKLVTTYSSITKRANIFNPVVKKVFYTECGISDPIVDLSLPSTCQNKHSTCNFNPQEKIMQPENYFCMVEVEQWLRYLVPILEPHMRFVTDQQESDTFHDVQDGDEYTRLTRRRSGRESLPTLTITVGFDGVPYTSDNSKSLWPLVGYINELPFMLRKQNGMLLCLHAGKIKATDLLFRPFVNELKVYEKSPLEIEFNDGTIHKFWVKLLLLIADAPARAVALNCLQYNSYNPCNNCYITGFYDRTVRIYPSQEAPPRTGDEWRKHAYEAEFAKSRFQNEFIYEENSTFGVKGKCELLKLTYVEPNTIAPADYMHSVELGIVRMLVSGWLTFFTKDELNLINMRLDTYCFPIGMLRPMPKFGSKEKWKAYDAEVFLFYDFLALKGIMREDLFDSFAKLAYSISCLCQRVVKRSVLDKVDVIIKSYLEDLEQLYENGVYTYNVHCLRHQTKSVRNFGPLLVNSAYMVENTMGWLAKRVETGKFVQQQIFTKALVAASLYAEFSSPDNHGSKVFKDLIKSLLPHLTSASEPFSIVRCSKSSSTLQQDELQLIQPVLGGQDYTVLKRVVSNKLIITSEEYDMVYKHKNCYVEVNNRFYTIIKLISIESNFYAIAKEHHTREFVVKTEIREARRLVFPHIKVSVGFKPGKRLLKLNTIENLFSFINIDGYNYILRLFNQHI